MTSPSRVSTTFARPDARSGTKTNGPDCTSSPKSAAPGSAELDDLLAVVVADGRRHERAGRRLRGVQLRAGRRAEQPDVVVAHVEAGLAPRPAARVERVHERPRGVDEHRPALDEHEPVVRAGDVAQHVLVLVEPGQATARLVDEPQPPVLVDDGLARPRRRGEREVGAHLERPGVHQPGAGPRRVEHVQLAATAEHVHGAATRGERHRLRHVERRAVDAGDRAVGGVGHVRVGPRLDDAQVVPGPADPRARDHLLRRAVEQRQQPFRGRDDPHGPRSEREALRRRPVPEERGADQRGRRDGERREPARPCAGRPRSGGPGTGHRADRTCWSPRPLLVRSRTDRAVRALGRSGRDGRLIPTTGPRTNRAKWCESGTIRPARGAHSTPARSASSSHPEEHHVFGSRTTLADPLPEHDDDWSADRLAAFRQRLAVAAAVPGSTRLGAAGRGARDAARNVAVAHRARRGRARPAGAQRGPCAPRRHRTAPRRGRPRRRAHPRRALADPRQAGRA